MAVMNVVRDLRNFTKMRRLQTKLSFFAILLCIYARTTYGQVTYCTPTGGCPSNDKAYITSVRFNTLNSSSACGAYTLFPESGVNTTTVEQGASYQMSVGFYGYYYDALHGVYDYYIQTARAYIDFNGDGDFEDAGEHVVIGNGLDTRPAVGMISIPADAKPGKTRLRIRHGGGDLTACNSLVTTINKAYDIEDYTITIAPKSVVPPPCPTVYSPANNATNVARNPGLTFTWSGSTGGTNTFYDFYLGTSPTSLSAVGISIASTDGVTARYAHPDFLEPGTIYYYKVVAKNDRGVTSTCGVQRFTTSAPTNDYYCTPQADCGISFNSYIKSVVFNTLSNTSSCAASNGYTLYATNGATTTTLTKGVNYTLRIETGLTCNGGMLGMWIDYNRNGSFDDAGEFTAFAGQPSGTCVARTVSVTVPAGAVSGTTRMRVRLSYGLPVQANESCSNYSTGETEDYTVTIAAAAGCNGFAATYTKTDNVSAGGTNGSITVTPSGGASPYSITWAGGAATGFTATGLSAGVYYATVADGVGCTYALPPINISAPLLFELDGVTVIQPSCKEKGSIRVDVRGGVGPYTTAWNDGMFTGNFINNLDAGTYSAEIRDSQGQVLHAGPVMLRDFSATYTVVPAVCGLGSTGEIHVTTVGGIPPYRYKWIQTYPGDPVFIEAADIPASVGVYTVTITDAANCSIVISDIEVSGPPPLAVSLGVTPVNCNGNGSATGEIRLTTANGTAPYRYELYANGVVESLPYVDDAQGFRYIDVPAGQPYTVIAYDANGCRSTEVHTDGVNTLPEPDPAWGFMISCSGKPAEIKYGGYVQGMNFVWYADADGTVPLDTAVVFVTPVLNQTVTYFMGNYQQGCTSVTRIPYTVSIAPTPGKPQITTQGSPTLCQGNTVLLVAPQGYQTYRWSTGEQTMQITTGEAGSYTVAVVDDFGCESAVSDPLDVVAGVSSVTPVITSSGALTFCAGGSVVLTAPAGYMSYRWSDNSDARSVTVKSSGVYSVRGTQPGACESEESAAVTVEATPLPAAPLVMASGSLAFCSGGQVVLTASGSGQHRWSTGDASMQIEVTESGTYTVTLLENNCEGPASSVVVSVFDLPQAPEVIEQVSASSLRVVGGGDVYAWSVNGVALDAKDAEITAMTSGRYEVRSVSDRGCVSAHSVGYDFVVTALEQTDLAAFSLYPNPSAGAVHVSLGDVTPWNVDVQIINSLGREVGLLRFERGVRDFTIDTTTLPAGLYTLILRQGAATVARSFVRQ